MKWIRRHDGAPILRSGVLVTRQPEVVVSIPPSVTISKEAMPENKVVQALQALKGEIDKASDELIADARKQHERTKDGFNKVRAHVLGPLDKANSELEDYVKSLADTREET